MRLLSSGRHRRDTDRAVIEDLGYSAGLWNGQEPSVSLRIGCGMYSPHLSNAVTANLPRSDEGLAGLASPEMVRSLVRLLIDSWNPDWATWTSYEWCEHQGMEPGQPVLGWMTYLGWLREPKGLPSGVTFEPLGTGMLIIAAEEAAGVTTERLKVIRECLGDDLRQP